MPPLWCLLLEAPTRVEVDARRRDEGAEPVEREDQKREQDLVPEIGPGTVEDVHQVRQHCDVASRRGLGQVRRGPTRRSAATLVDAHRFVSWLPLAADGRPAAERQREQLDRTAGAGDGRFGSTWRTRGP